ncbi:MAG TPA: hypothetical protein VHE59_20030 [Mucilaginibacter sp.]|nr:hypothetical protein [Mucilaginibacter sp.]
MKPVEDNAEFFFSVKHIIKPHAAKLIYGIRYNEVDFFILKSLALTDCELLDDHLKIAPDTLTRICYVISEIEKGYNKPPPLEWINIDIFNMLMKNKGI